jgi:hypothetical protein
MRWYGLEQPGPGYGQVQGSCDHGNESSGSITCWEVLEELCDWRIVKKSSAPLS